MTPKSPPRAPSQYKSSVTSHARRESQRTGTPTTELVELHYHRRLLARVFTADGDSWLLKGGQSMLVRWPSSRHSTDIDLVSRENTLAKAIESLIEAAKADLGDPYDPLTYVYIKTDEETGMERPTKKVHFEARFGNTMMQRISIDVVTAGERPRGTVVSRPLVAAFDSLCTTWPEIRIYPLEDVVGDKLCALYTGFGANGTNASKRYKDLVDLALVALNSELPADFTHEVVHLEAQRRRDSGTTVRFPDRFAAPDETWADGYARAARNVEGLPLELRTLSGVHPLADAFITPLLQAEPPAGRWRPSERSWR